MRNVLVAVCLFLAACAGPGWTPRVATQQEKAVVVLEINEVGSGAGATGTMIGDGLILTARHVARACPCFATTYDGSTFEADTVYTDANSDVGVLRAKNEPAGQVQDDELGTDPFVLGETVYAIGHPHLDPRWVFTFGKVTSDLLTTYNGYKFVVTNMTGAPGMSGGPVFGPSGKINGVISIGYGSGMGLGITPLSADALAAIAKLRNGE